MRLDKPLRRAIKPKTVKKRVVSGSDNGAWKITTNEAGELVVVNTETGDSYTVQTK